MTSVAKPVANRCQYDDATRQLQLRNNSAETILRKSKKALASQ